MHESGAERIYILAVRGFGLPALSSAVRVGFAPVSGDFIVGSKLVNSVYRRLH